MSTLTRLSKQEWSDRGRQLFGDDFVKWRFVCPACGNIATVEDYRQFKEQGADANAATCTCIGRYMGKDWAKGEKPCDYVGYGLFRLSPVIVMMDDKEIDCFAFDESDSANAVKP